MVYRNQKIGLIGRTGEGKQLFDGQTVKTRNMLKLLRDEYGSRSVITVDTFDWRHRFLQIIVETCRCLLECKDIVVLLSENGRRAFFPVLAFSARTRGTRVYQNLIGGALARNLNKYPQWVNYLNEYKVNWVESHQLVAELSARGISNAKYLPNFKYFKSSEVSNKRGHGGKWRFCTFSRVMEQKGVGDAIRTVESLNDFNIIDCELHVYGPIDKEYQSTFNTLLEEAQHCKYVGSVSADEGVDMVRNYDALLFPTKWRGEGIPGTVIDALAAGVPIIGAHWEYFDEMLQEGVTGFSYEFGHNELLADTILKFVALTNDERNAMGLSCLERAKAYTPEVVAFEIRREIER